MSNSGDDTTSPIEWALLIALFSVGLVFFVKPAAVTVGAFVDFLDAFPEPRQLGPYGSLIAAAATVLGGGGLLRKKFR